MYIRRKVFSVIEGEDRLFSTTEYELNHNAIERYFSDYEDEEEQEEKKGMSKAKKAAAILGGLALAAGGTYGLSKLASKYNKPKFVAGPNGGMEDNPILSKLAVPSEFIDKYGSKGVEWLKKNSRLIKSKFNDLLNRKKKNTSVKAPLEAHRDDYEG